MRTAVITICSGEEYKKIANLTHPLMQKYSDKIGAEFVVLSEKNKNTTPHWLKFYLYRELLNYDKIIYLDTDIIVKDSCPSLFEIVPNEMLGIFNESSIAPERIAQFNKFMVDANLRLIQVNETYNTGVMVFDSSIINLFKLPSNKIDHIHFEQPYLNYNIHKYNIPVFKLPYKFNRMMTDDKYFEDGLIVHYAGTGGKCYDLIKKDLTNTK